MFSTPEVNNTDILLETNTSELSTILSAESDVSNKSLLENENNINDNDSYNTVDSELHFENENNDNDGIAEMDDVVYNRCGDHENNDLMIQFENDEQRNLYALETLREWAFKGGVSMKMLDNLLLRLKILFPILPKSYKTLLQTPPDLGVQQLRDGTQLWYKGIRANLDKMLLAEYLNIHNSIVIDINIWPSIV